MALLGLNHVLATNLYHEYLTDYSQESSLYSIIFSKNCMNCYQVLMKRKRFYLNRYVNNRYVNSLKCLPDKYQITCILNEFMVAILKTELSLNKD